MAQLTLVAAALLMSTFCLVHCGDFIPHKFCATFFSMDAQQGEYFNLEDFFQSPDLSRDYRASLQGWPDTKSLIIMRGCTLAICSDTYYLGDCLTLTDDEDDVDSIMSVVRSANCTCERKCGCQDTAVPQDLKENGFVGRAYLQGGCNKCNAEYLRLRKNKNFPEDDRNSVKSLVISEGCDLGVCSEPGFEGKETQIKGPLRQVYKGKIGSYKHSCIDPEPAVNSTGDESAESNGNSRLPAAIQSAEKRRSSKNGYVILIGARVTYFLGFPQCRDPFQDNLWECRLPVNLEKLGISSELRVITLPIGYASAEEDAGMVSALESYLSSHDELKNAIPNAVIVYHWIHDLEFAEEDSVYQRKLETLERLRHSLVDESYSNVVFLLDDLANMTSKEDIRQPERRISEFEEMLAEKWTFPYPLRFCLRSTIRRNTRFVNGHMRMENGEYFPLNLETSLDNICAQAGDPLGQAIFKAAFLDDHTTHYSIQPIVHESDDATNVDALKEKYTECCENMQKRMKELKKLKAQLAKVREQRLDNEEDRNEQIWEALKLKWETHIKQANRLFV